jgi:hypothetical protein
MMNNDVRHYMLVTQTQSFSRHCITCEGLWWTNSHGVVQFYVEAFCGVVICETYFSSLQQNILVLFSIAIFYYIILSISMIRSVISKEHVSTSLISKVQRQQIQKIPYIKKGPWRWRRNAPPKQARNQREASSKQNCSKLCLLPSSRLFLAWLIIRPWGWMRHVPPKRRLTCNGLHGVISQKMGTVRNHRCENLRSHIFIQKSSSVRLPALGMTQHCL